MIKEGKNKKIILILILIFCLSIIFIVSIISRVNYVAEELKIEVGDIVTRKDISYQLKELKGELFFEVVGTKNKNISGEYKIVSNINNIKVIKINTHAFTGCVSITGIVIPNTITTIESFAFSSCSSLKSITIPNSVTLME